FHCLYTYSILLPSSDTPSRSNDSERDAESLMRGMARTGRSLAWLAVAFAVGLRDAFLNRPRIPPTNPVGIQNRAWTWRGCQVRYQVLGEENTGPSVVLIHGLLVNADHWRKNLPALAEAGLRVYALDLLGNGYTDRLEPGSEKAAEISGERGRELRDVDTELVISRGVRQKVTVPQRHPLGSVYNIFTWSEQVSDFIKEMVKSDVFLVGNSLGSLVSLQAAIDSPNVVRGLLLVNPRFRQEHVSEAPAVARPVISWVQRVLRETPVGGWLFNALSTEAAVTEILKEPYYDSSQVTPELVEVLRSPLLLKGALESTLDILSYSTGPLLEQLLQDMRPDTPVWVCWGERDPWTPLQRVSALDEFEAVKKLVEPPVQLFFLFFFSALRHSRKGTRRIPPKK
ncbi:unnamed protein product, partial [Effrenium voratum]